MFRASKLASLGVVIGLSAFLACGGESGQAQQQAASEESAGGEMAEAESSAMQQGEMALPEGVTQEMVDEGRQLFTGAGLCSVCHGNDGKGMPGLGANLTDSEWIHGDGSYEFIVQNVMSGVSAEESTTGTAMPPKGGSGISDEQVKAVAAYAWTLSHK